MPAPLVLIVDDEPEIRAVIGEYLTEYGFGVLEASNGLEALVQVKRGRPRAVILDLRMPRLGGLEALRRIRDFDATIGIVVLTGDLDPSVRREALAMGAVAVLRKPLNFPELLPALGLLTGHRAETGNAPGPDEERPRPTEDGPSVLVVDDESEIRAVLAEFLLRRHYAVRDAADGNAALREIAQAPPDVILLDIMMPGLSGVEALPVIRALAPRTMIIMVSGTLDIDLARRALAEGAFDYVTKPVDLDYLTQSLEIALATRPEEEE